MKAATTSGLALVLAAFLFLCPMGLCTQTASASAKPTHPCCPANPAPVQNDLPGCSFLFMDTGSVPSVTADADLSGPVSHSFDNAVLWDSHTAAAPLAATVPFSARPRFVTLHQFLI